MLPFVLLRGFADAIVSRFRAFVEPRVFLMRVSPAASRLPGLLCVLCLSDVEGDGRRALEGGHKVGGHHVVSLDAVGEESLSRNHRDDVDSSRNGGHVNGFACILVNDAARVGQVVDGDSVHKLNRFLGENFLGACGAGRLDNEAVHPLALECDGVRREVDDLVNVVEVGNGDVGVAAERHVPITLELGEAAKNEGRSLAACNGAGDENLVAQLGECPCRDGRDEGALALADRNVSGRDVRRVLGDDLNACERTRGGRSLGDDVGLEEGGSAVLVADDRAIGELGGEAHEALDGGVRHGVFSFSPPGGLVSPPGWWFGFWWRFSVPPTTCSLHV